MSNYTFEEPRGFYRPNEFRGLIIEFPYYGKNKHAIAIKIRELLLRSWGYEPYVNKDNIESVSKLAFPFIIDFIKKKIQNGTLKDIEEYPYPLSTKNTETDSNKLEKADKIKDYTIEL